LILTCAAAASLIEIDQFQGLISLHLFHLDLEVLVEFVLVFFLDRYPLGEPFDHRFEMGNPLILGAVVGV
jgi:hypothetical protein